MTSKTDDLRIEHLEVLSPPAQVIGEQPATSRIEETVTGARRAVQQILHGPDDRLLVVVGPCSIHDPRAAMAARPCLSTARKWCG